MKILKKTLKITLISIITITAILGILAIYVFTAHSKLPNVVINDLVKLEKDNVNIVVLGDSLAAGVYSDGSLIYNETQPGHGAMIAQAYHARGKLSSYINYAVPGYETSDLLNDIIKNRSYNDVLNNSILNEKSYLNGLEKANPSANFKSEDITINKSISQADIIIINIGANDVLNAVSGSEEGIDINLASFKEYLDLTTSNVNEIESLIRKENPNADIYFYGIYFAMPHKSDLLNFVLQPLLNQIDVSIFKGANSSNNDKTHTISIKEHYNAHLKTYIDNPDNIHPNIDGYNAMAQYYYKTRLNNLK